MYLCVGNVHGHMIESFNLHWGQNYIEDDFKCHTRLLPLPFLPLRPQPLGCGSIELCISLGHCLLYKIDALVGKKPGTAYISKKNNFALTKMENSKFQLINFGQKDGFQRLTKGRLLSCERKSMHKNNLNLNILQNAIFQIEDQ